MNRQIIVEKIQNIRPNLLWMTLDFLAETSNGVMSLVVESVDGHRGLTTLLRIR
jgi:hypothetical protein